jgi:hypothetical protein
MTDEKETAMATPISFQKFLANLERERFSLVERFASEAAPTADELRALATVQGALTAVREEIATRGVKPG